MVAAYTCPGARKIVCHEINVVDKLRHSIKVDVFENVLTNGKSRSEKVVFLRQCIATLLKKPYIISALFGVSWMFPINLKTVSSVPVTVERVILLSTPSIS